MKLRLRKSGSDVTAWISYTESFGAPFATATVRGEEIFWTDLQGCAERFRKPGYNYDNPGQNIFTVRLRDSVLFYTQETIWTSPCDGHPVGTETVTRRLRRIDSGD